MICFHIIHLAPQLIIERQKHFFWGGTTCFIPSIRNLLHLYHLYYKGSADPFLCSSGVRGLHRIGEAKGLETWWIFESKRLIEIEYIYICIYSICIHDISDICDIRDMICITSPKIIDDDFLFVSFLERSLYLISNSISHIAGLSILLVVSSIERKHWHVSICI